MVYFYLGDAFQARASSGSLYSVIAVQWTKPYVSLLRLFYFDLSDAFC